MDIIIAEIDRTEKPKLDSWAAMKAWNPTFQMGMLPSWFKQRVRNWHKRMYGNSGRGTEELVIGSAGILWDHWGKVKIDDQWVIITQPYIYTPEQYDKLLQKAQVFAEQFDVTLYTANPDAAIWYDDAGYFEFREKR
jgi:hypothetical protein